MRPAGLLLGGLLTALALPAAAGPTPAWTAPSPAEFRESGPAIDDVAQPADGRWWRIFNDPVLDALIDRGDSDGAGIQQAAARLAQARALVRSVDAGRWPQAGLGASASRQSGALVNAAGSVGALFNLGANLSYEVDLFGRLAKADKAARLDASSRESLLRSVRLLTQAQIAQTYFEIRALDQERALLRSTAASDQETLAITQGRLASGLETDLGVARADAELAATQSQALALDRARAELEHALAFLVGDSASAFRLGEADLAAAPPSPPPGIPSDVLKRRPDVDAAERSMEAARLRLGLARTAWLPNLSLTASGGYASSDLANLLSASARSFGAGALLALPLFDGGRRQAGIAGAKADVDLASAQYREQVLGAFRDVEDQLSALRLLGEQATVAGAAVDADTRATRLTDARFEGGLASRLEVLDAHRTELRDRRSLLQTRAARYVATVSLIRALGGGWAAMPVAGGRTGNSVTASSTPEAVAGSSGQ
jgi:multidrug efflux system outer membrane protein